MNPDKYVHSDPANFISYKINRWKDEYLFLNV